ncbi:MAG: NAD(P)-dependent oxidoreductase [Bdellovibrionales bacterium]|nr:NAD(P)-dependent oxidoreductase [Bdellovibrionales bacterium]
MKKILVTGANGFVGSAVCKELLDNNYQVTALHRSTSDLASIQNLNLNKVAGDIRDLDFLKQILPGHDGIIHIAALFRQAKHPDQVYFDINVQGVKNVFDAAIESGVKRIIHCSTVGVHSHIPNPPADENEIFRPGDIYQESKAQGEKLAQSYFDKELIEGLIIRPAMIWGPGDSRTLKLFKGIANKRFPLIGTGKTSVHWVLVSDLARAFRLALEKSDLNKEVFIIAGQRPVEMQYMVKEIAKNFNVSAPRFKIPALPIQVLGTIVETICIPFGIEPPIYRRRVDFFTKTRAFNWQKAKKLLKYEPEYSFETEVKKIAAWYLENNWIEKQQEIISSKAA